jgi:hypothetical protein
MAADLPQAAQRADFRRGLARRLAAEEGGDELGRLFVRQMAEGQYLDLGDRADRGDALGLGGGGPRSPIGINMRPMRVGSASNSGLRRQSAIISSVPRT